jgi:hypothetical protein
VIDLLLAFDLVIVIVDIDIVELVLKDRLRSSGL